MGFLPLAKGADGIIRPTSSTWDGAVTLHWVSASERSDACFWTCGLLTFDFFNLHRSHALHTRLRTLQPEREWSDGDD